jgi:hypothetical protein
MTTTMHLSDDDLVLHHYGERDASGHLGACGDCRSRLTSLQQVLAAVDTAPEPVLPEGFERTVWARLEPALPARSGWRGWVQFSPARLALAASVLLLVTASFYAGRVTQPSPAAPAALAEAGLRDRILLMDLNEHLDRSQTMLVELVSAGGPGDIDMALERSRAEDLVAANRLYRQTAGATGDRAVQDLLDDLERLLVDLAAAPDALSEDDIQAVRARIESEGLLFKVRVLSTAIRERQQEQIRRRGAPSS